jgi:nicotinamide-nucleotide amidase
MKGTILSVGDELLIGQVTNTNATWLAERLATMGVDTTCITAIGDEEEEIVREVDQMLQAPGLVIVTGGLGPTHDDITREALSRAANTTLELDREVERLIREKLESRGRTLTASRRTMALVPRGFRALSNPIGLAPGLLWEAAPDRLLVALPGIPAEMKAIFDRHVVPVLQQRNDTAVVRRKTLLTAGITESRLAEIVEPHRTQWPDSVSLAFLPGYRTGVRMRLAVRDSRVQQAEDRLNALVEQITNVARDYVYGSDGDTLEGVVGRLLVERSRTIAVAESCTGGLIMDRLTDVPGSSEYLLGGIVAYANSAKVRQVGVPLREIEQHGAVSRVVAEALAKGVRERFGASIGLSATGIAGPGGGTPEKPVGTVWIGFSDHDGETAVKLRLMTDRRLNKEMTATAVLSLLWRKLGSTLSTS